MATHLIIISIEVIDLARRNDIHLVCLPSHTTHLLQPLDVGVFKSLKSNYSKQCQKFLSANPGRVISTEDIASLLGIAWPISFTPVNIMAGFKKSGSFPLNPGEVTDRHLAPSKGVSSLVSSNSTSPPSASFTSDQHNLYEKRFAEGYDVPDADYQAWLAVYHSEACSSDSLVTHASCEKGSTFPVKKVTLCLKC